MGQMQQCAWGLCWKIMTLYWNIYAAYKVLMLSQFLWPMEPYLLNMEFTSLSVATLVYWPVNCVALVIMKCQLDVPLKPGCLKHKHEFFMRRMNGCSSCQSQQGARGHLDVHFLSYAFWKNNLPCCSSYLWNRQHGQQEGMLSAIPSY